MPPYLPDVLPTRKELALYYDAISRLDGYVGRVRAELGDAGFDAGYAEGVALTLDQAVATALAVEHPDLAADSLRFSS